MHCLDIRRNAQASKTYKDAFCSAVALLSVFSHVQPLLLPLTAADLLSTAAQAVFPRWRCALTIPFGLS